MRFSTKFLSAVVLSTPSWWTSAATRRAIATVMTAGVLFTAGTVPMAPSAVVPVAAAADKDKADKDKSDKDKADKNKARPIASPAPKGPINNPVDAANAIVKDISPLDELGRPKPEILNSMRALADQPGMDKKIADLIHSAVSYYEGEGEPGVNMPALSDAPAITQFGWPAFAGECIGGSQNATGTAFAVSGPAKLPVPGVPENHTAFVFTALGTGALAEQQRGEMTVQWVNMNTLKHGVAPLKYNGINPSGPATVSGTAETGRGTIVAWLSGTINTKEKNAEGAETVANCTFTPTAGIITN